MTGVIRARLPALTSSLRRVGQAVLDDPGAIIHLTVTDVAERTETSEPTVVRFCKEVGLKGFADLKIRLAAEWIPPDQGLHQDVAPGDTPADVLGKVLRTTSAAIAEAGATLDRKQFERVVEVIGAAKQVLFAGVGTSAPLAQDAAYRFRSIGIRAEAPPDVHVQHVTARLMDKRDACVAFSHTGQTRETLAVVAAAREARAVTVVITSFLRSPLVELADLALVAGSGETNFRVEAMASRIAHISVLDALFVATCLADPERARKAQQISAEVLAEHRI